MTIISKEQTVVHHSSRDVALASMNMSVFKTRLLMKPLIIHCFLLLCNLPTFKLPRPSQPRIRAPQSASTSLHIGPLRAARIGPVKKCKRYPRRPNMMGICGPSGERWRGPPAVACIGPLFCRRADIPVSYTHLTLPTIYSV